ncbi:MAG: hypothetical protein J6K42_05600 [Clostridia bacterium]|nr:hypothetical protein [Clostridia bacterium]
MKNILKFLILIFYLISIFYINNIIVLIMLILMNLLIMIFNKISLKGFFKNIALLLPFVIFTVLINCFIIDYKYAVFIGIRLILAYMISYLLSKMLTIKDVAIVIQRLLIPLKIFKIDNKKIGLIIFIALSIIPNVLNELQQRKYSIKSKSTNINLKNLFLIVKSVLVSMLIKVNEYENALVSKGYSGE